MPETIGIIVLQAAGYGEIAGFTLFGIEGGISAASLIGTAPLAGSCAPFNTSPKEPAMSGYVFVPHADACQLFTDGARFDRSGTLLGPVQKVVTLGHMPAAFTVLGTFGWLLLLQQYLIRCDELDAFLDTAGATMKALFPAIEKVAAIEGGSPDFELLITGFSRSRGRLGGWMIRNTGQESSRWSPIEITEPSLNPGASPGAIAKSAPSDGWSLPRDAVQVMQAQRDTPHAHADGLRGPVIGCFVQRTLVTAEGVSTGIVHRWPDAVGAPIPGS